MSFTNLFMHNNIRYFKFYKIKFIFFLINYKTLFDENYKKILLGSREDFF
jgi:hypothetical protein